MNDKARAALASYRESTKGQPRPKRPSLKRAIWAMCKDCIFDPMGGGSWRQQVERCTSPECPLYEVRPRSASTDTEKVTTRCDSAQEISDSAHGIEVKP